MNFVYGFNLPHDASYFSFYDMKKLLLSLMALSILTIASHASNGGNNSPAPTVTFSCLGSVLPVPCSTNSAPITPFQGDAPRINIAASKLTAGSTICVEIYPNADPVHNPNGCSLPIPGAVRIGLLYTDPSHGSNGPWSQNLTCESGPAITACDANESGNCSQSQGGNCGNHGNCGGGNQGGNCGGGSTSTPPVYSIAVVETVPASGHTPATSTIISEVNFSVVTGFAINTQVGTLQ
jgi:hypothetical protein